MKKVQVSRNSNLLFMVNTGNYLLPLFKSEILIAQGFKGIIPLVQGRGLYSTVNARGHVKHSIGA